MRDLSVHFVLSLISRQERSPVKNKRAEQLKTTETGSKGDGGGGGEAWDSVVCGC